MLIEQKLVYFLFLKCLVMIKELHLYELFILFIYIHVEKHLINKRKSYFSELKIGLAIKGLKRCSKFHYNDNTQMNLY